MRKDIYTVVERQFEGRGVDYLKKEEIVNECTIYHFENRDEALEGMGEVLQAIFDFGTDNFKVSFENSEEDNVHNIVIKEID